MKKNINHKKVFAKTTDGLSVGMSVEVKKSGKKQNTVITSIFDKWCVGTPIGSFWADNVCKV